MLDFVTIVTTETRPDVITISYMRDGGHVYVHVPKRLVRQCAIISGQRFLWFVKDGKVVMEQEKLEQEVESGPLVGISSAKAE